VGTTPVSHFHSSRRIRLLGHRLIDPLDDVLEDFALPVARRWADDTKIRTNLTVSQSQCSGFFDIGDLPTQVCSRLDPTSMISSNSEQALAKDLATN